MNAVPAPDFSNHTIPQLFDELHSGMVGSPAHQQAMFMLQFRTAERQARAATRQTVAAIIQAAAAIVLLIVTWQYAKTANLALLAAVDSYMDLGVNTTGDLAIQNAGNYKVVGVTVTADMYQT